MGAAELAAARVPENDGQGASEAALAGLSGPLEQLRSPRLRSAALATRPLRPYAHQDEAVFDHMLPQPRLRFLLADEPGTGKTVMTGMYLVEGRRRGLIPGPSVIVVPAHLVQKWQEELEDFFGVRSTRLTPEVARDPKDLDPRVDVWVTSVDLFTHNPDVRRKVAGKRASWSLAVVDEAHRLTPHPVLEAAEDFASNLTTSSYSPRPASWEGALLPGTLSRPRPGTVSVGSGSRPGLTPPCVRVDFRSSVA